MRFKQISDKIYSFHGNFCVCGWKKSAFYYDSCHLNLYFLTDIFQHGYASLLNIQMAQLFKPNKCWFNFYVCITDRWLPTNNFRL